MNIKTILKIVRFITKNNRILLKLNIIKYHLNIP